MVFRFALLRRRNHPRKRQPDQDFSKDVTEPPPSPPPTADLHQEGEEETEEEAAQSSTSSCTSLALMRDLESFDSVNSPTSSMNAESLALVHELGSFDAAHTWVLSRLPENRRDYYYPDYFYTSPALLMNAELSRYPQLYSKGHTEGEADTAQQQLLEPSSTAVAHSLERKQCEECSSSASSTSTGKCSLDSSGTLVGDAEEDSETQSLSAFLLSALDRLVETRLDSNEADDVSVAMSDSTSRAATASEKEAGLTKEGSFLL